MGSVTGSLESSLLRLRIRATSSDAAKPLFIGIARTEDVARYLARVRRLGGGAPAVRPSTQRFWQMHASGTGTQTLSWPVKSGQWSAVVMNADGSRNVSVDAQLAARLSGAWWFVVALLALGALALAGGILLVRSALTGKEV